MDDLVRLPLAGLGGGGELARSFLLLREPASGLVVLVRPSLAGLGQGACERSELLVLLFREPASGLVDLAWLPLAGPGWEGASLLAPFFYSASLRAAG